MKPVFDTVRVYRPAGSSLNSNTPESSVNVPRPSGSSGAEMNARARFTGRALSDASTRPAILPDGVGVSFCCAGVSRAGVCARRDDWAATRTAAAMTSAEHAAIDRVRLTSSF